LSKSKERRERAAAEKIAARKALEAELGLKPGELAPKATAVKVATPTREPGYYGNGRLGGVVYQTHVRRARA
jgi:hypothetical protein